jgi:putative transposase
MIAAVDLANRVGVRPACTALGVARPTFYRRTQPKPLPSVRPRPPLALTGNEEQAILDILHCERFVNDAPAEIHATLLDEGNYLCSVRTMYRVLDRHQEVRERRRQLVHPPAAKPELIATAPNQVWSWDITKLLGPAKWSYFYLYVLMDIFSRYVVGWLVAERESSALAQRLISESAHKQGVEPGQLTVHSDRGPSMTSKGVAQMLADMGITKTHSRPYTSNDNPFSEALFKTTKYRPEFPDHFATNQQATAFGRVFFPWYNTEHHHGGLGFLTPQAVHYGDAQRLIAIRADALNQAFERTPQRFKGQKPSLPTLPTAVYINPPTAVQQRVAEKRGAQGGPVSDDPRSVEVEGPTSNRASARVENQSLPEAAIH